MNPRHVIVPLVLASFASAALAQECPVTSDVATYPTQPLTYPMTSNRYAIQYKLASGDWTDTRVYISYYGGTNSSPYIKASNYPADTSMSFASIPAAASTAVALRVTKLFGSAFPATVSTRPRIKGHGRTDQQAVNHRHRPRRSLVPIFSVSPRLRVRVYPCRASTPCRVGM